MSCPIPDPDPDNIHVWFGRQEFTMDYWTRSYFHPQLASFDLLGRAGQRWYGAYIHAAKNEQSSLLCGASVCYNLRRYSIMKHIIQHSNFIHPLMSVVTNVTFIIS